MLPAETDDKIISLLQHNADLTYKEIAKKLKLNESTVRKRIISLRKRGVIRRFLVEVDTEQLGYKVDAVLGIDVDPVKIIEVGKKLSHMPETRMVFNTSGDHDFFAVVWTKDRAALSRVMDSISALEGVKKIIPSFMVERLK